MTTHIHNSRSRPAKAKGRRGKTSRRIPLQERSRDTVDVILRAAAHVLASDDYARASTNRIAAVAGVSIGSLYQYFPDKEAIFAAVLERHVEHTLAVVAGQVLALGKTDLSRSVHALVRALFGLYAETPGLHLAMYLRASRVGRLQKVVLETYDRAIAVIVLYLRAHREELAVQDLERAAYLLAHAIDGTLIATVFHRPSYLTDERFIRETADMALRYLLAPGVASVRNIPR